MRGRPITAKTKESPALKYFQFRLEHDLFQALVAEVEFRRDDGEDVSINSVGQEAMRAGLKYFREMRKTT